MYLLARPAQIFICFPLRSAVFHFQIFEILDFSHWLPCKISKFVKIWNTEYLKKFETNFVKVIEAKIQVKRSSRELCDEYHFETFPAL